ncbi:MAG: GspH/FimT family pseudopilin [Amphritea sp.]
MDNTEHNQTYRGNGFTLVELLITLAIFMILITVAIPSFSALIERSSVSSTINLLRDSHAYARLEAVKRQQRVRICSSDPTTGGCTGSSSGSGVKTIWNDGLLIFIDGNGDRLFSENTDEALRLVEFPDSVQVQWNRGESLVLNSSGGGSSGNFRVFTSFNGSEQRLRMTSTGRARTER